ncbi:MAG: glycosyltransferase, partial [Rubrivivax sp.]|nr:glycosyltransferase [Rubrivivax sp.]
MYRNQRIAVVVPAYNEETQITRFIETMPEFIDTVVIVNDKSRDRTAEVVRAHPRFAAGRVHLIDHAVNQ